MYFHLPQLNPYLATGSDFTHGVNFAVIGATANGGGNSLAKQLGWFKTHLTSTFHNPAGIYILQYLICICMINFIS